MDGRGLGLFDMCRLASLGVALQPCPGPQRTAPLGGSNSDAQTHLFLNISVPFQAPTLALTLTPSDLWLTDKSCAQVLQHSWKPNKGETRQYLLVTCEMMNIMPGTSLSMTCTQTLC